MRDDFCVFILSHGRSRNIKTLDTLKKANYTGNTYIIIDDEDETAKDYYSAYGESVIMFNKLEMASKFDTADNFKERRTIVYARNACFDIAKDLGIKYFLELDDDYTSLEFRYVSDDCKLKEKHCIDADSLFEEMIKFLEVSRAVTVAFAQGGDFIGGAESANYKKGILRKAMNTFFCCTDKRFDFLGRVNEDVNTYINMGSRGFLFFSVTNASITQVTTQKNKGGMTEQYLDSGTFLKTFYSVMYNPSCVKVSIMGDKHKRIHHKINWNAAIPKIISDKYKKGK